MKLSKIALLLAVIFILFTFVTSCKCAPDSQKWYLRSYVKSITFIGGVERNYGFSRASVIYPFASADFSKVYIEFGDDGSLTFSTWEGEKLNGTYTYDHTLNYTNIYFTFDNGETVTASAMKTILGEIKLMFVFRNVTYTFTPEETTVGPTLDEIVATVVGGETEGLHPATVENTDSGYVIVFSEFIQYETTEQTAIYAVQIHADGSYDVLDEVLEGEALSTYNEQAGYVVLYYIEK